MDIAVEKFLTKIKDREGDRTATYDLPIGLFVLLPWVATRHRMQENVVFERVDPDRYVFEVEQKIWTSR